MELLLVACGKELNEKGIKELRVGEVQFPRRFVRFRMFSGVDVSHFRNWQKPCLSSVTIIIYVSIYSQAVDSGCYSLHFRSHFHICINHFTTLIVLIVEEYIYIFPAQRIPGLEKNQRIKAQTSSTKGIICTAFSANLALDFSFLLAISTLGSYTGSSLLSSTDDDILSPVILPAFGDE